MPLRACLLLALLFALPSQSAAAADGVTIYRCTGADGHLTLRDTPCASGQRQEAVEMVRPQDPPPRITSTRRPPQPAPAAVPAAQAPVRHVVIARAPQPLYECTTPDGDTYTSDSNAGNPRWVPLWTLGYPAHGHRYRRHPQLPEPRVPPLRPAGAGGANHLHNDLVFDGIGRPAPRPPRDRPGPPRVPPQVGLAHTAGTWIVDQCRPLPHAVVCERMRDRRADLRRRYNSALQGERDAISDERRTLAARLEAECPAG